MVLKNCQWRLRTKSHNFYKLINLYKYSQRFSSSYRSIKRARDNHVEDYEIYATKGPELIEPVRQPLYEACTVVTGLKK